MADVAGVTDLVGAVEGRKERTVAVRTRLPATYAAKLAARMASSPFSTTPAAATRDLLMAALDRLDAEDAAAATAAAAAL